MKRTALVRRTALKRGAPLRRGKSLPKVAARRSGIWSTEREQLVELHRRVIMIRWGKFEVPTAKGDRMMWYGKCEKCGNDRPLARAHIMPVGRVKSMEFDADNALPLCTRCHIFWWHKFPTQAVAWIREKLGNAAINELERRATPEVNALGVPMKMSVDFGTIRLALTRELRRLTNGREPAES